MSPVILVAVLLLAYSNGANDNFKGVATLFGSATTSYRRALSWATVTTLAGSLLSLLLAKGLVAAFTGKGLVPDSAIAQPAFLLAVSLGGALTVLVATWAGLPVSTTHALTGGLVGAGLLATGGAIRWTALLSSFAVPLLMSPLLSMLATLLLYPVFRLARRSLGITRQSCVCVGDVSEPMLQPGGAAALNQATVVVETR